MSINRITSPISLDTEIEDADNASVRLSDIIADTRAEEPDENLLREEQIDLLYTMIGKLKRKHGLVFRLYNRLDEETRNMPGSVTFSDVVKILRKKYPKEKWSIKSCEDSNRRAWQRLKN